MTLVAPEYFDFGLEVMEKVSGALTTRKMQTKMGSTKESKRKMLHDKYLL